MDESENDNLRKIVNLNDLIHTPVRMAILFFLKKHPIVTFPEIKIALNVTSGNLSSHLKKLAKAELLFMEKKFVGAKPTTEVSLTSHGLKAISEYRQMLNSLLDSFS